MGTYLFCDSLSLKTVSERIHAVAQIIEPAEGTLVTIKYADGGSNRKRFFLSQPSQVQYNKIISAFSREKSWTSLNLLICNFLNAYRT
jgi:hypothetical protein